MKKFFSDFFLCGIIGWCTEIIFTSLNSLRNRDFRLMGVTSLWMFPIYGMASVFDVIYPQIKNWSVLKRGLCYGILIMSGEYISGSILNAFDVCPWDYKDANGHAHLCENSGCTAHDSIIPHTPNIADATEEQAKVCTVCDYVIAPKLNHVHALTPISATPATCTENGNIAYYTCTCGQWFSDSEGNTLIADHSSVVITATGHNYEGVAWSSDANEHYKVCKNTNCSEKGEVAPHTPNIANPTEEEAKVCTVCQYVIAPALNHVHTLTPVAAKGATCTENGNIAYYTCTCGQWFSDSEATNLIDNHDSVIVVASGHTDANTDGTCDTCGWVDPNFTPVVPGPGEGEGTPEPTPDNTPDTPEVEGEDEEGLSAGAIAGIAVGATAGAVALGAGGFAIFWFVIKKKSMAELLAIFKKAPKVNPENINISDDIVE